MAKPVQQKSSRRKTKETTPLAFRKYTNLAVAIDMLQNERITLLDPALWPDKNDAWFMQEYQDILGTATVLATCFAETEDTHHHWRVFSDGIDGVCIEFDKERILSAFEGLKGIRMGQVQYRKIETLRRRERIAPEELLFLKRRPYKPECEYRVIYVHDTEELLGSKSFQIEIDWIKRITLSPWLDPSLRPAIVKTLRTIAARPKLKVVRSTLLSNRDWRALTKKARPRSTSVPKMPSKRA